MIFFSLFKTLEGKVILLELKNSLQIRGTLSSVDQYLNLKLENVEVVDKESFPQLVRIERVVLALRRTAAAQRPAQRAALTEPTVFPHSAPPPPPNHSSRCAPCLCAVASSATCTCPPSPWTRSCCRTRRVRRRRLQRAAKGSPGSPP